MDTDNSNYNSGVFGTSLDVRIVSIAACVMQGLRAAPCPPNLSVSLLVVSAVPPLAWPEQRVAGPMHKYGKFVRYDVQYTYIYIYIFDTYVL